jgi:inhibitor of cysteine peptidase
MRGCPCRAFALSACAWFDKEDDALPGDAGGFVSEPIAAPNPGGAEIKITEAEAGKTVAVPLGASFVVQLRGVPTAGYLWAPASVPDFLVKAGEAGGPTSTAQLQPGFAGGTHWEVFAFKAERAGSGVLTLEQRRPWESSEPPAETFKVTIETK